MDQLDLIIRGGYVVDGSGGPGFLGDVGILGGRIVAVGAVDASARREIDAKGKIVTPGFVDIHTHYDGQVTWESRLIPSSDHGTTTVVAGNCGVGFAPCRPADREKLVKVMEGVEDIPEVVMTTGLPWTWESFAEYLDTVEQRHFDADVAVQIAHSPVRVFVMGDRGVDHEPSTEQDREEMAQIVEGAIRAGAIGVSTSRSINHRAKDGTLAPSVTTAREELLALAEGLRRAQAGVFQIITETSEPPEQEIGIIRDIAETSQRPVSFTLAQTMDRPSGWRGLLAGLEALNEAGFAVRGQVMARPVGVLLGLDLSFNPLSTLPSYREIAHLPLPQRVAILRDPDFKSRVLAETPIVDPVPLNNRFISLIGDMFLLGDPPNYAPPSERRLGFQAREMGVEPLSLAYDLLLEDDGRSILYLPSANFADGDLVAVRAMLDHPLTVPALGDGGAHYGVICDAGYTTYILTHWVRDAPEGVQLPLEWAIAALTRKAAETVGLLDRGLISPGLKADINVIDLERLALHPPQPVYDLPAGGRRLRQRADGYAATIVNGQLTYENGQPSGALPGRLVRGATSGLN